MQDRERFDDGVEVRSEEIPEDFGPEEAFKSGGDLVYERLVIGFGKEG